jgi:hypothetical protein
MPIRIGPKGRHLQIPDGWELVTEGFCSQGDRFLDASLAKFDGKANWILSTKEDWGDPFDQFDVLIRTVLIEIRCWTCVGNGILPTGEQCPECRGIGKVKKGIIP